MHRGGVFAMFRHLASFAVNDRHHSPPSSDGFPFENDAAQEEKVPSHVGITFRAQQFQLTQRDGRRRRRRRRSSSLGPFLSFKQTLCCLFKRNTIKGRGRCKDVHFYRHYYYMSLLPTWHDSRPFIQPHTPAIWNRHIFVSWQRFSASRLDWSKQLCKNVTCSCLILLDLFVRCGSAS